MITMSKVLAADPEQLAVHSRSDIRLRGSKCTQCGEHFFPRRWICAIDEAPCEDVELSPYGRLHVATYVHKPSYGKAQVDTVGYGVGQIDLPEGPRIQSVLLGDPLTWVPGTPVKLVAEQIGIDSEHNALLTYRFAATKSSADSTWIHRVN